MLRSQKLSLSLKPHCASVKQYKGLRWWACCFLVRWWNTIREGHYEICGYTGLKKVFLELNRFKVFKKVTNGNNRHQECVCASIGWANAASFGLTLHCVVATCSVGFNFFPGLTCLLTKTTDLRVTWHRYAHLIFKWIRGGTTHVWVHFLWKVLSAGSCYFNLVLFFTEANWLVWFSALTFWTCKTNSNRLHRVSSSEHAVTSSSPQGRGMLAYRL